MKKYTTQHVEDWQAVAESVVANLPQHDGATVIVLSGTLGAGKTTFVQALARVLGVGTHVTSPTFVLMNRHETKHERFRTLLHIDAYRIDDESEAKVLRLADAMLDAKTLICIEWAEHIPSHIPQDAVHISIDITQTDGREIIVSL